MTDKSYTELNDRTKNALGKIANAHNLGLVIFATDSAGIIMPNIKDKEPDGVVPLHLVLCTALATRLMKDKGFKDELLDWLNKYMNS